jgi:hypothetical protein
MTTTSECFITYAAVSDSYVNNLDDLENLRYQVVLPEFVSAGLPIDPRH